MQHVVRRTLLMLMGLPAVLGAQGFGIYEHDACAMGRAGTGAASPCSDGSAIFFNPAGLAGLKGWRVSGGATLIQINGSFTDDQFQQTTNLDDPLIPVPQVFVAYGMTPKLAFGAGFFAPYGLQTVWPLTFDGRFVGYDNKIQTYYIQPTVAYQVAPWLKIGGGIDIVHGSVKLHQRLDLATTPVPVPGLPPGTTFGSFGIPLGTDFADADLEASNTSYGGHFGAIAKVNDRLSIGAHYLMKVSLDYTGTANFTQVATGIVTPAPLALPGFPVIPAGTPLDYLLQNTLGVFSPTGPLAPQTAAASIANPDMFVLGIAFKPMEALTLLADYQWTHWSSFDVLSLEFAPDTLLNQTLYENYVNTNGYRFGIEYETKAGMTVRGGYLYHGGAAPDETVTPLLPEGARNEFTGGLSIKLGPMATASLAYQYIHQDDRRGRTRDTPNVMPTTALNNGLYTFSGHLFGVGLAVAF
jgi:long-chain fatty acid transport protein